MTSKCSTIVLCLFSILAASYGFGQNNWTGDGSGLWSDPADWSLNHVPTKVEDVTILSGVAYLDTNPTVNSVILNGYLTTAGSSEQTLTTANGFSIDQKGSLYLEYQMLNIVGNLSNSGNVSILSNSGLRVFGSVENSGSLGGNVDYVGGSFLEITGNLTNLVGAQMLTPDVDTGIGGNFNNYGQVYLWDGVVVGGVMTNYDTGQISPVNGLYALGGLVNYGSIGVHGADASITAPFLNNGGTIQSSGYNGNRILVGTGTAAAPGYYQLANGTLGEIISPSAFGVIMMGDGASVNLDGTLQVMLQSGYNPAVGSTFEFLQFDDGALSGVFSSIVSRPFNNGTEYWVVNYDNASGYVSLTAEPVPELSSLWLLGSGLLSVGYGVRRQLKS